MKELSNDDKLYESNKEKLFTVGKITVYKSHRKDECYLINDNKTILFTPSRIRVFQMEKSEEIEKLKEHQRNEMIEKEDQKLKELTEEMKYNPINEIKQMEELLSMKFKEVVFDSDYCNWEQNTSTFDLRIIGKHQLMFLVETKSNETFGWFIYSRLNDSYNYFTGSSIFTFIIEI